MRPIIRMACGLAAIACVVSAARAQAPEIPASAVTQLANDLDELQAKVLAAQHQAELEKLAADPNTWLAHPKQVVVTSPSAKVFAGASSGTRVLTSARQGALYPVVDRAGDWYAVGLDVTSIGSAAGAHKGLVSGWISAKDVAPRFDYTTDALETRAGQKTTLSGSSSSASVFQALAESATAFRARYQNNPYFKVTGFSVSTAPAGLTLTFEFAK